MDLLPTQEQEQIIDAARNYLMKELPVHHLRWEPDALAARDRTLVPAFASLGWFGLGLAEADGGVGFGIAEDILLFREAGRFLVTPMLLAGTIGAHLAAAASPSLTAGLVSGETRCGLAIPAQDGNVYLIDAAGADLVLLVDAENLALVERGAFGGAQTQPCIDPTVTFQTAPRTGRAVATLTGAAAIALSGRLSLLIAALLAGNAEAVRDMTVAHACERVQFGQKIGTFQAVSHPLAEMAVRCDAAFSQVRFAAVTSRDGRADAAFQVIAARIVATDAALANASAAIQLHGAMGFTAELPVHFFLKRAHLLDQIGGRQAIQLDRFIGMEASHVLTREI